VNVTISNALYKSVFTTSIIKVSSFKNIEFVEDNSISFKGNNRTISLMFDSLGEPSCAIVWLTVSSNSTKPVAYGSNASYCFSSYSSIPFISVYSKINNKLNFSMTMSITGLATVHFLIKNDLESLKLTTTVTVSNLKCKRPTLNIQNRANNFLKPTITKRSMQFSVIGITTLDCEITLKNIKEWFLYEINPLTGSYTKTVDKRDIISSFSSEIYIPSNFLDNGTYQFIYQVTMDCAEGSFMDSVDSFIRIVPSGMAIFPFSGGIKEISIGRGQSIDLDPGRYSYDFDGLLVGTELTYKYYCRMIIDGEPKEFPSDYYQHSVDLQHIKDSNISIKTIQKNICFNGPGKKINNISILFYFK
jgi:hypothetical protein